MSGGGGGSGRDWHLNPWTEESKWSSPVSVGLIHSILGLNRIKGGIRTPSLCLTVFKLGHPSSPATDSGWNYTHRLSWVTSVPTSVSLHNRVRKFLRINLCLHVHPIGSVCLENPAEYHVEADWMQKQTGRSSLCIVMHNRSAKNIYTAMPLLSLYVTRSITKW